MNVIY